MADDSTIRIVVHDDGDGFDPTAGTDGFGLPGMQERTALLDGTLHVDSTPGAGTTVTAAIPTHRRGVA